MNHSYISSIVFLFLCCTTVSFGQDGALDLSFHPQSIGFEDGANGAINAYEELPDGKFLIAGEFTEYNGAKSIRIAKVNSDGSLDTSFNPGAGATGPDGTTITTVKAQPDGRILIAGSFNFYDGVPRSGIARLKTDGSLDETFDPGTGTAGINFVFNILLENDGKIILVGQFGSYNGFQKRGIVRINSDGSLDDTFQNGIGVNNYVQTIVKQADGKLLIGGDFNRYDGLFANNIARLNSDGTLDESFNSGSGANDRVIDIKI